MTNWFTKKIVSDNFKSDSVKKYNYFFYSLVGLFLSISLLQFEDKALFSCGLITSFLTIFSFFFFLIHVFHKNK